MRVLALLAALILFVGGCELVRWWQLRQRRMPPLQPYRYVRKPRIPRR
jgi:hypothetical protein